MQHWQSSQCILSRVAATNLMGESEITIITHIVAKRAFLPKRRREKQRESSAQDEMSKTCVKYILIN